MHAIASTLDAKQPMRNIRRLTGCLPRRSLAMIDHACTNRMHAITIATSRICDYCQHSCAAHRANNMVHFFFFMKRVSQCMTGNMGSVCAKQHTRSFPSRKPMHQILTCTPLYWSLHTCTKPTPSPSVLLVVATLQRFDSSS